MKTIGFFKESIRNLKTVGTFTRSSRFVCQAMVNLIDFSDARFILELGAGDGVITKHILDKMRPDAKLMTFEVNELFADQIREIDDPRLIIVQDSAEYLEKYMKENNISAFDGVISAIPFIVVPNEIADKILSLTKKAMVQGAKYVQLHYALTAKKLYENTFGNVNIHFVPRNLPPAWLIVSEKK